MTDLLRILSLQDYGTRVTVLGVMLLGLAGGVVGTFLLLRKRALLGDALAHATYPGTCIAFMLAATFAGRGKSMPWLLTGAAIAGLAGLACLLIIRRYSRVKEDAALAIVLSCFFGLGVMLKDFLQTGRFGDASGIRTFLEGDPAALLTRDAYLIGAILLVALLICAMLFKEFRLLCFDAEYAASQGWPTLWLDVMLMTLVTLVVIAGLQAVGLILVIAMLVIPPAAARFWTQRLGRVILLSGAIGAVSGVAGAMLSAFARDWPAGASIVTAAAIIFCLSLIFGWERGGVVLISRRRRLRRQTADDNLLRSIYELSESAGGAGPVAFETLCAHRSWSRRRLRRILHQARREGLVGLGLNSEVRLTEEGLNEARRIVRNHRLWEMYMITHADVAANHVDRGADMIEHILGGDLVGELEKQLRARTALNGGPTPAGEGTR